MVGLETESTPAANHRQSFVIPLALAALAIVARLVILKLTHSTTEDFFITLRYAENLAEGRGLTYNPGERVLGTTTPLYTLLLSLFHFLHLNATTFGKLSNILADGATTFLIARTLAALGRPRVGWLAALLFATASAPINFSIGGMETSLVTLAGLCAVYSYITKRPTGFLISLATLFLLRIDGLLLAAFLLVGWFVQKRRLGLREIGIACAIVLPWITFSTWYFGSPIPVSMQAKIIVYARMFPDPMPNLPLFKTQFIAGIAQKLMLTFFLVGAAVCVRKYRALLPAILWLTTYYVAMLVSKVISFGWYFMPPMPIYFIVIAIGVTTSVQSAVRAMKFDAKPEWPRHWSRATAILFGAFVVGMIYHLKSVRHDIAHAQEAEDRVRLPIGFWLRDHAKPTDRVLLEPIGYIGYYSRLPILDMVGLVSPEVLPSYRKEIDFPVGDIVEKFHPQLMVLRPSERDAISQHQTISVTPLIKGTDEGQYHLDQQFNRDTGQDDFFLYQLAK